MRARRKYSDSLVRERFFREYSPPPVDRGELTFLAVNTRTPCMTEFDGADGAQ